VGDVVTYAPPKKEIVMLKMRYNKDGVDTPEDDDFFGSLATQEDDSFDPDEFNINAPKPKMPDMGDNGKSIAKNLYDSHVGDSSFSPDLAQYDAVMVRTGDHMHLFNNHATHFGNPKADYHYFHDSNFPEHADHLDLNKKSFAVISPNEHGDYNVDLSHVPEGWEPQARDIHAPNDFEREHYHPVYNDTGKKNYTPVTYDRRKALDTNIVARYGDHPEVFPLIKQAALEEAGRRNDGIRDWNAAVKDISGENRRSFKNKVTKALENSDVDSIRGFDTHMSQYEHHLPVLMSHMQKNVSGAQTDPLEVFADAIRMGVKPEIQPHDPEIFKAVDKYLDTDKLMGTHYYDRSQAFYDGDGKDSEDENWKPEKRDDSVPFSKGNPLRYAMPLGPTTNAMGREMFNAKVWKIGSLKKVDGHTYILKDTTAGKPRWHLLKDFDPNQGVLFDPHGDPPETLEHGNDGPIKPTNPLQMVERPTKKTSAYDEMAAFVAKQKTKSLFDDNESKKPVGQGPKVEAVDRGGQMVMRLPMDSEAVEIKEPEDSPVSETPKSQPESVDDKIKRIVQQSIAENKNIWDLSRGENLTKKDMFRMIQMRDSMVADKPIHPARARAQELFKQKRAQEEQAAAVKIDEPSDEPEVPAAQEKPESAAVSIVEPEEKPQAVANFDELINDPKIHNGIRKWAVKKGLGKKGEDYLDDFTQEVLLAAHQNRHRFDPAKGFKFSTWIAAIANTTRINMYRHETRKKRDDRSTVSLNQPALGSNVEGDMIANVADHRAAEMREPDEPTQVDLRNSVKSFLSELPERERTILEKVYIKGQKQTDVAKEMGESRQNINMIIKRSIDKIRPMAETQSRRVNMVMERLKGVDKSKEKPISESQQPPQEKAMSKDLFGNDVKPQAVKKPTAPQPKETQSALFSTSGLAGQTQFLDEPGVPDELVRKPESKSVSIHDFNPDAMVKIAADDISKLRRSDVYRVLSNTQPIHQRLMIKYINDNRPDLKGDVHDAMIDIEQEKA